MDTVTGEIDTEPHKDDLASDAPEAEHPSDLFEWAAKVPDRPKSLEKAGHGIYPFADMLFPEESISRLMRPALKIFIPLFIFAAAMAFIEASVEVYLRKLWEVETLFPLEQLFTKTTKGFTGSIEFGREVAALVMLVSISCALGRNAWQRIAYLLFLFGTWHISYYGWMWIVEGWPAHLDSWDILFYLPRPLVAPIYAPMAVSGVMIFCGMMIIHAQKKQVQLKSTVRFWVMELLAFALVYTSFAWQTDDAYTKPASALEYPWLAFVIGITIGLTAFLFLIGECLKRKKSGFDLYVSKRI